MKALIIKGSKDFPTITLDKENKIFEFSGRSFPEDAVKFYQDALDWLTEYIENPLEETILVMKMDYISTASSKVILQVFFKFEELASEGKKVSVKWYYAPDDEDMQETGVEYEELLNLDFEHIPYS